MPNTKHRCGWCKGDTLYTAYHDLEWGVPLFDEDQLFEFLILETFQAGLSWITILRKRDNFRQAFNKFDYKKIAQYTEKDINSLMDNEGIIRNRQKIKATISNAQSYMNVQQEFGSFSSYIWEFVNGKPIQNSWSNYKEAPSYTALSETISKDLKKRGFKFIGPTVVYAHMQATGMVNDHEVDCYRYEEVKNLSKQLPY